MEQSNLGTWKRGRTPLVGLFRAIHTLRVKGVTGGGDARSVSGPNAVEIRDTGMERRCVVRMTSAEID